MAGLSAVIFLPDDTGKTGLARPLLLQNLMGAPLLSWLVDSLAAGGVERFFLVCRPACEAAARDCFPEGKELVVAEEGKAAALFSDFLAAAGDDQTDVIVVTGPCVLLPYDAEILALPGAPEARNLLCVKKTVLQQALADKADLLPVLEAEAAPYTDRDGAFTIESLAQLTDFQPLLNRAHLYRLAETGVEIWDFGNTYIDPTVTVAPGVTILPGTILRGKTTVAAGCVLGPNTYVEDSTFGAGTIVNSSQVFRAELGEGCHVGPFAYVRAGTKAGNHVKIGDFVEVRSVTLGDNAKVAHLSYVGDSEVGSGALIRGIELQTPEVGQKIVPADGSERRVEQLLELLAALEEKGMLPGVSGIDFSQDGVISMDYAQRFAVKFAYGADFSYKLAQLNKVIEQLEAQGDMRDGTIDMTNETDGRINFIPD